MWTVSYERISEDKTGEAAGVTRQHRDNKLLAQAKGHALDRRYTDNSISALDETKTRPEFEKLLVDVAGGKVGVLVVWHLDRLAVRMADLAKLLEAGRPHQLQIAAVHGVSIDLGDPTGVAVAQILVAVAEMERRHKGMRHKAANRQRAESGIVGWTRRPFGYDRVDGEIVIVPEEAAEYRRMVQAVLGGATLASVTADLNKRGVTTSLGGRWTQTPVRRILLNPRHAGRAVSKAGGADRLHDFGEGAWPAIIDEETHYRLVLLLTDPRRTTAPSTRVKYLLSGLIRCGICGERMFASPALARGKKRMVYKCFAGRGHLTRNMEPVDEHVENRIIARLERPDAARLFAPDVDLDGLRARAVDLRGRRDAIAAMLADGLISSDAGRTQATKLTGELVEIEREIDAATGSGPLAVLADTDDIRRTWEDDLDLLQKRAIIDTVAVITMQRQGRGSTFDPETVKVEPREPSGTH